MSLISRISSYWRNIVRRGRVERDLDEELRATFDALADEKMRGGMLPEEAGRAARLELGGIEPLKEAVRDVRGGALLTTFMQDVRYALRWVRREPGFAAVAVLTLALGIGATTTVFSVVHTVLLRHLPYPESDRLVVIASSMPTRGLPRSPSALPDYREWGTANRTLDAIGAYHAADYALTGADRPERLKGSRVTASVWTVLQVPPQLGSTFSSREEAWGSHRVVVLSHALWVRRFGGDPSVVGGTVRLDDELFSIVGVMPRSFRFPDPHTDMWTPLSHAPGDPTDSRSTRFVHVLGRLRAGTTVSQANADLSAIAARIAAEFPENAGLGVVLSGWQDALVGDVKPVLWLLFGAVGCVLAIACANVAGLLVARGVARRKELSVRAAMGAAKSRLLRQLLTENLVLAGLGALLGGGLAYALIRAVPAVAPAGVPRLDDVALDGTVLAFAAGLAMLTGLIFGLWPAWRAGTIDPRDDLNDSPRGGTAGASHVLGRKVLVLAEVSLSLVLLVGAMLLIVSLVRVQQVDPGFRPEHLLTMQVSLSPSRYTTPDRVVMFADDAVSAMTARPGVSAAAATTALPLGESDWGKYLAIEGRPTPVSLTDVPTVRYRAVTPGYFRALGATLRAGRAFEERDGPGQPRVAIVNETAARRFWPDASSIGARVSLGPPEALAAPLLPPDYPGGIEGWRSNFPWFTVVGIVADLRSHGLEREANPEVFIPLSQAGDETGESFYLIARTVVEPLSVSRELEASIHEVDPNQPVSDIRPMTDRLAGSLTRRRFATTVLALFAGIAVVLTLVGLYGLMAYTIGQRRREIGIRLAVGAQPRDLLHLMLKQGLGLAAGGIAVGLLLAAALSRLMSSQLYAVQPVDPWIYAIAALLLLVCAGVACLVPSQRAARLDPLATLREG